MRRQIQLVDGASHALVFGDQLLQYLNQIVQMYQNHMHPGATAGPADAGNAGAAATPDAATDLKPAVDEGDDGMRRKIDGRPHPEHAPNPRFLKYPYSVGGSGIPNTTTADDHLRDLILQVLFTNPGERVNLPDFGVGVQRLLFQPSDETLRSSAQFLISTNLQRWLGDRINVEQVRVTAIPATRAP